jgi:hypothetical protein
MAISPFPYPLILGILPFNLNILPIEFLPPFDSNFSVYSSDIFWNSKNRFAKLMYKILDVNSPSRFRNHVLVFNSNNQVSWNTVSWSIVSFIGNFNCIPSTTPTGILIETVSSSRSSCESFWWFYLNLTRTTTSWTRRSWLHSAKWYS